ncbi:histidine phosphatase family protein [Candidatus Nucleicultrix amoebiphila]|jgi:probable phosphoglycerate mutase|uniref:histidine phosphatase family protein n=1 Tax=Candidatus Nucleicultrix amoebiphila TaxID=1509244 RepID=UPI000A26A48D|nr:histidine phosphatase family protein [Candidatus Nucleicultrix amoebiphila]
MIPEIPFYYIRHGETEWNRTGLIMGQSDIPLNETGIRQAHEAKSYFSPKMVGTICYSPLKRAQETASILNEKLQAPLVAIENLKECSWGVFEGTQKADRQFRAQWMKGGEIEGAESLQMFLVRARGAILEALKYPGPVLIVSHGGVYWAVLEMLGYNFNNHSPLNNCDLVYHQPPTIPDERWFIKNLSSED